MHTTDRLPAKRTVRLVCGLSVVFMLLVGCTSAQVKQLDQVVPVGQTPVQPEGSSGYAAQAEQSFQHWAVATANPLAPLLATVSWPTAATPLTQPWLHKWCLVWWSLNPVASAAVPFYYTMTATVSQPMMGAKSPPWPLTKPCFLTATPNPCLFLTP